MTIEIPKKEPLNIVPFIDRKNARPSVRRTGRFVRSEP